MCRPRSLVLAGAAALAISTFTNLSADEASDAKAARFAVGVSQLRQAVGAWSATTEFLNPDGSVAGTVQGSYSFEWVVPDRVLSGLSTMQEPDRASGILFYVRPDMEIIEMVSVGADGQLWVMTGPIDSEVRMTPNVKMPDGRMLKLRFTRYNVSEDGFESKMEMSRDDGNTWTPGNHQVFVRAEEEEE